jgi:hypothetical protein
VAAEPDAEVVLYTPGAARSEEQSFVAQEVAASWQRVVLDAERPWEELGQQVVQRQQPQGPPVEQAVLLRRVAQRAVAQDAPVARRPQVQREQRPEPRASQRRAGGLPLDVPPAQV